jgi:hypothetical protein
MLQLKPGLGKSCITLTSIAHRMAAGQIKKTLVVGPLRVIHGVWRREARKWSHLQHLRFTVLHGDKRTRLERLINNGFDIALINYENLSWLADELKARYLDRGHPLPFDMVVYDEVTRMKNSTSKRGAAWRKLTPHFKFRTGLTGTPAANGYIDLHGQYLVVDGGQRLGTHVTHFRDAYFESDYMGWSYAPTELGKRAIEQKISDITISMDAKDLLKMPELQFHDIMVDLPPAVMTRYREVEDDMFTRLDCGTEIEVFNQASVSNKCLQMANGAAYLQPGCPEWAHVHDEKLEALDSLIEESAGNPILLGYQFKSDAQRIMERYKRLKPVNLTEVKGKQIETVINNWQAGKIPLMIGHPACLGPDTEVLTECRGWVNIVDVVSTDRVFDGVDFVNHGGAMYSGFKPTIDVLGITMTPDHKLWINGEWVEGKDVRDSLHIRCEAARLKREIDNRLLGEVSHMRGSVGDVSTERSEEQPEESITLQALHQADVSQHDKHPYIRDMARSQVQSERPDGSKLWGTGDRCLRAVGQLSELLRGHVAKLLGRPDNRAHRCERPLLERELPVGNQHGATVEQAQQQGAGLLRGGDAPRGTVSSIGRQQDDDVDAIEQRDDSRTGGRGCEDLPLRQESTHGEYPSTRKAHVYDIVDCGPRHRFVVRNDAGEVFISHNSMGHGIDGLQDTGGTLVWFGLPWSLELYDQMICRLYRQGGMNKVIVYRLMARDTLDLAVADALARKDSTQEGLKVAINNYRRRHGLEHQC